MSVGLAQCLGHPGHVKTPRRSCSGTSYCKTNPMPLEETKESDIKLGFSNKPAVKLGKQLQGQGHLIKPKPCRQQDLATWIWPEALCGWWFRSSPHQAVRPEASSHFAKMLAKYSWSEEKLKKKNAYLKLAQSRRTGQY